MALLEGQGLFCSLCRKVSQAVALRQLVVLLIGFAKRSEDEAKELAGIVGGGRLGP